MRNLGHGHSVMFFAPLEVDRSIRAMANNRDPNAPSLPSTSYAGQYTRPGPIFGSGLRTGHESWLMKSSSRCGRVDTNSTRSLSVRLTDCSRLTFKERRLPKAVQGYKSSWARVIERSWVSPSSSKLHECATNLHWPTIMFVLSMLIIGIGVGIPIWTVVAIRAKG